MSGIANVEEVVIAVKDQDAAVALYEGLFGVKFDRSWTVPWDNMKVKATMLGKTQMHVVSSMTEDGLIAKFIQEKGEGFHHIALRVRNLEEMLPGLREKNVKLVPEEPLNLGPARYIFIHPKSTNGVLIELIEIKDEDVEVKVSINPY